MQTTVPDRLAPTRWTGQSELWLDPAGDDASRSECTLNFDPAGFTYTWSHEGRPASGNLRWGTDGIRWSDTWHQPEQVECRRLVDRRGLLDVEYDYEAGDGPPWGWRITLTQRPDDTLVLQMTNIAPWGEEARAVRMLLARANGSGEPT